MKSTAFFDAFYFTEYLYDHDRYTDARAGASRHYIGLMEEGYCRIVSDEITIEAGPGDPFYIPLNLSYQSYWFCDDRLRFLSYGFDHFPESEDRTFLLQVLPREYADLIRSIPLKRNPDSSALGSLFTVLHHLIPAMARREPDVDQRIRDLAIDYMRLHPYCRMTEVAIYCGVSESLLYSSFRKSGSTPNKARQSLLIREANRMLSTTDIPIQEISDRMGFSSSSYFRKVFYAHMGKTPSQVRKSRKNP